MKTSLLFILTIFLFNPAIAQWPWTNSPNEKNKINYSGDAGIIKDKLKTDDKRIIPGKDDDPPYVIYVYPYNHQDLVPVYKPIIIYFSEPISSASIDDDRLKISADGIPLKKTIINNDSLRTITILPDSLLPELSNITILISASLQDTAGSGLDGNYNGIAEGSPIDDYHSYFSTGAKIDSFPPAISYKLLPGDSIWIEISPIVKLEISDTSLIAVSPIISAEYFVDVPGPDNTGNKILADDGKFDSPLETAEFKVNTKKLELGDHKIYIHAIDSSGNWSNLTVIEFHIINQEDKDNWSEFGANALHTSSVLCDSLKLPLKLLRQKELSTSLVYDITIYNGLLYTLLNHFDEPTNSTIYEIYKMDLNDGSEKFIKLFSNKYYIGRPALSGGFMLMQHNNWDKDSYIAVYDLSANLKWKVNLASRWNRNFPPVVSDGIIILPRDDSGLYAFDLLTGKHLWNNDFLVDYDTWIPAVPDSIFYSFNQSNFKAINLYTGKNVWSRTDIPWSISDIFSYKVPVIDTVSGIIILTSKNFLTALDIKGHSVLWNIKGNFDFPPAVFDRKVYIVDNNIMTVYDINSGNELWSYDKNKYIFYQPVVANGIVYFSSDTHIYAADARTFEIKWDYLVGGAITIAANKVVVSSPQGILYIFDSDRALSVSNNPILPGEFNLEQNFPNPFNAQTNIRYALPADSHVSLKVFSILGEMVKELINANQPAGYYSISLNAKDLSSGVYLYQLETEKFIMSKKFVLIK